MKPARYILLFGIGTALLIFVLAGGSVFAQGLGEPCGPGGTCNSGLTCSISNECLAELPEGPQTAGAVLQIIQRVGEWVFAIFLAISIIFLVWGAFEFVTGEGNPEKVSSAKRRLLYAIIGIGLALLANGVDDVLRSILT
ncbi:hypothetical protein IH982_02385 [Patescibacteria group bacterium]|nr:hypothetical protein [Patescibacteria group bacterium]